MNLFRESYTKVIERLISDTFKGFDPYDGSSSEIGWLRNQKYPRLFSTYFNKFSPVNFRSFLKIKPTLQNQALGFIGRAMIQEQKLNKSHIKQISDHLIKDSQKESYGYHCWDAHGFPIQMLGGYRPAGMTDIIGNEAIGRFFLELYKSEPKPLYKEICISVRDFFLNELAVKHKGIHHFRYKHITPAQNWCYNASAIGAAYVEEVSDYFQLDYDKEFTKQCLKNIIDQQKPDGQWYYSLNLDNGDEKPQVDFHQGFVLDAILEHMQLYGFEEPFLNSYKKGLEFYHKKQFLPNGQGIYRYPRKWPVNIHNQAQGIITFTRAAAAGFGEEYHQFARTIAQWTIQNMQDKDGHFYFLKYPLFTNKIPYIRWSDAAMAYALAVLLEYEEGL